MAAAGTPDIRGEQREELVQDLAVGSLTHAQLAEKHSRHPQAIAQFAVRNKAEIAVVQAGHNKALHERLDAIPIADQARRIAGCVAAGVGRERCFAVGRRGVRAPRWPDGAGVAR
jgi:hypothetical protein